MFDFNVLENLAKKLVDDKRYDDALKVYYFMADGDPTLEAGFWAERIGFCYEMMGYLHAAKYWYGRATEENPGIDLYAKARERLNAVSLDELIDKSCYTTEG